MSMPLFATISTYVCRIYNAPTLSDIMRAHSVREKAAWNVYSAHAIREIDTRTSRQKAVYCIFALAMGDICIIIMAVVVAIVITIALMPVCVYSWCCCSALSEKANSKSCEWLNEHAKHFHTFLQKNKPNGSLRAANHLTCSTNFAVQREKKKHWIFKKEEEKAIEQENACRWQHQNIMALNRPTLGQYAFHSILWSG